MGHNLGLSHDILNSSLPYICNWGLGYANPVEKWRTIMAYDNHCPDGCPRIPYWSNPFVEHEGNPVGEGLSYSAYVLNRTSCIVSRYSENILLCSDPWGYNDVVNKATNIPSRFSADLSLFYQDIDWFEFSYNGKEYYIKVEAADPEASGCYNLDFKLRGNRIYILTTNFETNLTLYAPDQTTVLASGNPYVLGGQYIQFTVREGCTDPNAGNYDSSATVDDGSCESGPPPPVDCSLDGEVITISGINCSAYKVSFFFNGSRNKSYEADAGLGYVDITNRRPNLTFPSGATSVTITVREKSNTNCFISVTEYTDCPVNCWETTTNCWESYVTSLNGYREETENSCDVIQNGVAYLAPNLASTGYYWTNHVISKDIPISGDECKVIMRVKDPRSEGGISAYDTRLSICGSIGNAWVLYIQDAEYFTSIGAGTTSMSGRNSDLYPLSQNLTAWHEISLVLQDNVVSTFYDGTLKYQLPYEGSVGNISGLGVLFKGSGILDWIKVYDLNDNLVYSEEFNSCTCAPTARNSIDPTESNEILTPNTMNIDVQQIKVFPNPLSEFVNLTYAKDFDMSAVRIYDLQGRMLKSMEIEAGTMNTKLNLEDLQAGVYLLHVIVDGEIFTERLVVN